MSAKVHMRSTKEIKLSAASIKAACHIITSLLHILYGWLVLLLGSWLARPSLTFFFFIFSKVCASSCKVQILTVWLTTEYFYSLRNCTEFLYDIYLFMNWINIMSLQWYLFVSFFNQWICRCFIFQSAVVSFFNLQMFHFSIRCCFIFQSAVVSFFHQLLFHFSISTKELAPRIELLTSRSNTLQIRPQDHGVLLLLIFYENWSKPVLLS